MGLDIEDALNRVGGDSELLKELFEDFMSNFSETDKKLKECLERGDINGSKILIHSFKGVSGSLGANDLHLTGKEIEDKIKENIFTPEDELFSRLEFQLGEIKIEMSGYINCSEVSSLKEFNQIMIIGLLDELTEATKNKKVQEIKKILKELLTYEFSVEFLDIISDLTESVKSYNFSNSNKITGKLLDRIKE